MSEQNDQHNQGGYIAFLFSIVFVFSFMFYLSFIHTGVNLDEKVIDPNAPVAPGQENQFNIAKVAEPWVPSEDMIAHGKKVYQTNCSMCHGAEGKGDGAAGAGLNPKPRNLIVGEWTKGNGLVDRYKVLTDGITGTSMASYAHFKPADRWALVHFIESITQNKSKQDAAQVAEFAKTAK